MVVQYQLQSLWLSNLIKIDRIETLPAVAPRATAFITSVARLTPPSTKSWNFSLGKLKPRFSLRWSTTSISTSMPERAKSN